MIAIPLFASTYYQLSRQTISEIVPSTAFQHQLTTAISKMIKFQCESKSIKYIIVGCCFLI